MATKKRLIDANVVLAKKFTTGLSDASGNYYGYADVVFADDIENAPTVDAVEVVHAHWVKWWPGDCSLIMTGEEMLYQCSACTAKFSDVDGFRYCPHCGALMEGINHVESDDQA